MKVSEAIEEAVVEKGKFFGDLSRKRPNLAVNSRFFLKFFRDLSASCQNFNSNCKPSSMIARPAYKQQHDTSTLNVSKNVTALQERRA
jgi:hypothetical protein